MNAHDRKPSDANEFDLTDVMKRELGVFFRQKREQSNFTQEEVAKRAGFDSPNVISKIEIGKHTFPLDTLFKVATALSVPMASVGMFLDNLPQRLRELPPEERDYLHALGRRK